MLSTLNCPSLTHVKLDVHSEDNWNLAYWAGIDMLFGNLSRFPNLQTLEVEVWNPELEVNPLFGLLPLVESRGILSLYS